MVVCRLDMLPLRRQNIVLVLALWVVGSLLAGMLCISVPVLGRVAIPWEFCLYLGGRLFFICKVIAFE